jgi:hypothetical protein
VARVADPVLQGTIIGEQNQAFAVPVQAPGGIDARGGDEIGQGGALIRVRELTEDVERFI